MLITSIFLISITLKEAIERVLEKNLSLESLEYTVKAAEDLAKSSISYLLPRANINFNYSRQFKLPEIEILPGQKREVGRKEQSQLVLSLVQAFPIDFSVWYARQAVISAYRSQKWSYENTKNEVLFTTANLYISISNLTNARELAQENYDRVKKRYETAQRLFESGIISRTDLLRIETSVYEAELQIRNLDLQIHNTLAIFSSLLLINEENILPVQKIEDLIETLKPEEAIEKSKTEIKSEALKTPDILSLENTVEQLDNQAKFERGKLFPQLSLGFSLLNTYGTFIEQRNIPSLSVGISLNIDFGGSLFSYLSAEKRKISAMYQLEDAKLRKQKDLENIFKEYEITKEKIKVAQKRLEFAQRSLESAQEFFERGRITSVDLLDYELQFENAKIDVLNSKSELLLLFLKLKKIQGKIYEVFSQQKDA
ncbi:MAG: TolC family protein [Candidatus Calescibacterium sp.]|nr:TolC family protein [Candidatus Calescibacterium sp.]MCX7733805.1 TolC family protein [bacterium]MDW8086989.1 TolC family protein [Candidatus Calescibacterium sp.]